MENELSWTEINVIKLFYLDSSIVGPTQAQDVLQTRLSHSLSLAPSVGRIFSSPVPVRLIEQERLNGLWPVNKTVSFNYHNRQVHMGPHKIEFFSWLSCFRQSRCLFFGLHIECRHRPPVSKSRNRTTFNQSTDWPGCLYALLGLQSVQLQAHVLLNCHQRRLSVGPVHLGMILLHFRNTADWSKVAICIGIHR